MANIVVPPKLTLTRIFIGLIALEIGVPTTASIVLEGGTTKTAADMTIRLSNPQPHPDFTALKNNPGNMENEHTRFQTLESVYRNTIR